MVFLWRCKEINICIDESNRDNHWFVCLCVCVCVWEYRLYTGKKELFSISMCSLAFWGQTQLKMLITCIRWLSKLISKFNIFGSYVKYSSELPEACLSYPTIEKRAAEWMNEWNDWMNRWIEANHANWYQMNNQHAWIAFI